MVKGYYEYSEFICFEHRFGYASILENGVNFEGMLAKPLRLTVCFFNQAIRPAKLIVA
jgi:hypothetical protein